MSGIVHREPSAGELEAFWQGLRDYNARFVSAAPSVPQAGHDM
jgi:hypothetical protein